jgi:hypothetical protein
MATFGRFFGTKKTFINAHILMYAALAERFFVSKRLKSDLPGVMVLGP